MYLLDERILVPKGLLILCAAEGKLLEGFNKVLGDDERSFFGIKGGFILEIVDYLEIVIFQAFQLALDDAIDLLL